jgi:hypothetical protein
MEDFYYLGHLLTITNDPKSKGSRSGSSVGYLKMLSDKTNQYAHALTTAMSTPDFLMKARCSGGYLYKTIYGKVFPKKVLEAYQKMPNMMTSVRDGQLVIVSPKLNLLVDKIKKLKGKHFVYTASGSGCDTIYVLANLFTQAGFVDRTEIATTNPGALLAQKASGLAPGFVLAKPSVMGETDKEKKGGIMNLKAAFDGINPKAGMEYKGINKNGEYIRVVIATQGFFQGFDTKGLRYIHLLEPMPGDLMDVQLAGRGVRDCSHMHLKRNERRVTLYRYYNAAPYGTRGQTFEQYKTHMVDLYTSHQGKANKSYEKIIDSVKPIYTILNPPPGLHQKYHGTADSLIRQMATNNIDRKIVLNFEEGMKAIAVDCSVMRPYHPNVQCGIVPMPTMKLRVRPGAVCGDSFDVTNK